MTIANDLTSINTIKQNIKEAIVAKGVDMTSTTFDQYPTKIANISSLPVIPDWVRPADWLALPTIGSTEQKFVGLYAVTNDDSNFVALLAAGAYTVDWGDGVVENFATNTKASHQYTYANISDSTLCSRGYKQVVITVTPQAGNNLTRLNFTQRHSSVPGTAVIQASWLDIAVGASYLNYFTLNTNIGSSVRIDLLEQVTIIRAGAYLAMDTNLGVFVNCTGLQIVNLPDVITEYNTYNMFAGCSSLKKITNADKIKASNGCVGMFQGCSSLTTVSLFDTAGQTLFNSMFNGCSSLTSVPLFNTSAGTTFSSMFQGCSALTSVPALDTTNGTDFSNFLFGCRLLTSVPAFDTAKGTNFTTMFANCSSLNAVPSLNTSNGTTFLSMFSGCSVLRTLPTVDTAKATTIGSIFQACYCLDAAPITTTALCNNFGSAFYQCYSLRQIPAISFAADTSNSLTNTFGSCSNLTSIKATGIGLSFTVANCKLSAAALNEIYTNLPTVTGKTITVTGNWGAATSTTSIATAKGWTVVI